MCSWSLYLIISEEPIFPEDDGSSEFVSLPDFGESSPYNFFDDCDDYPCYKTSDEFNSDSSDMVADETPFYANQEDDPAVAAIMFDEKWGILVLLSKMV